MKKGLSFGLLVCLLMLNLCACKNDDVKSADEAVSETRVSTQEVEMPEVATTTETGTDASGSSNDNGLSEEEKAKLQFEEEYGVLIPMQINVVNASGMEIGMFAIKDPITEDPISTGGLQTNTTQQIDLMWPLKISEIEWAIFDLNQEPFMTGTTDITGITERIDMVFYGEEEIDDFEVTIR